MLTESKPLPSTLSKFITLLFYQLLTAPDPTERIVPLLKNG